jgi:hypothetical protein
MTRPIPLMFSNPPADLTEDAQARWPGLVADLSANGGRYEVDIRRLADTLRLEDRLDEVRGELHGALTAKGSTGQLKAHPLLAVEASLAKQIADGFAALKLSIAHRPFKVVVDDDGRLKRR